MKGRKGCDSTSIKNIINAFSTGSFSCTGGSQHTQREWHDPEDSFSQEFAAASGYLVKPAGRQDQ